MSEHFSVKENNKVKKVKKVKQDLHCSFCDQKNKVRCCMWNSYYKQHKRTDWDSETFKFFKEEMFQTGSCNNT